MSEEWGPWIEHDGRGCPCRGEFVQTEFKILNHVGQWSGVVTPKWEPAFDWSNYLKLDCDGLSWGRVIRYRIRKPRGLTILENLIADLPETVGAA